MKNTAACAPIAPTVPATAIGSSTSDSLFEHVAWLYIFCRERLFRDDTARVVSALWPGGRPLPDTRLIELGCGPGFYSCRLASLFPQLRVIGADQSQRQLQWARDRAFAAGLTNCEFQQTDVLHLPCADETYNALLASRLFTVLEERTAAIAEMHRVLRPGGRCLIAEPRYMFWASIPLFAMWLLASVTRVQNGYREPRKASVLPEKQFRRLFAAQPWKNVRCWNDGRYQYALCEKA